MKKILHHMFSLQFVVVICVVLVGCSVKPISDVASTPESTSIAKTSATNPSSDDPISSLPPPVFVTESDVETSVSTVPYSHDYYNVVSRRLNGQKIKISDGSKTVLAGFKSYEITFELVSPEKYPTSVTILEIALPDNWELVPNIPEEDWQGSGVFFSSADIFIGNDKIGLIGIMPFELYEGSEDSTVAIYNQLMVSNLSFWCSEPIYTVIKEDEFCCTAKTKIYYDGRLFEDNLQRADTGILSYNKDILKYIGVCINDQITDKVKIDDNQVQVISESILLKGN